MVWATWAPAIITIATAIYIAGGLGRTIRDHDKRLDTHETELRDLGTRMTAAEAWREGYNAGRSK